MTGIRKAEDILESVSMPWFICQCSRLTQTVMVFLMMGLWTGKQTTSDSTATAAICWFFPHIQPSGLYTKQSAIQSPKYIPQTLKINLVLAYVHQHTSSTENSLSSFLKSRVEPSFPLNPHTKLSKVFFPGVDYLNKYFPLMVFVKASGYPRSRSYKGKYGRWQTASLATTIG